MEIRRARPGDGPSIGLVHVRSWQTTYKGIVPQEFLDKMDAEKRGAWWAEQLEKGDVNTQFLWVAVASAGQIVGFASGGPPQTEIAGYTSELYAIYLLESTQGQGVGRQLVHRVVEDLWTEGHRTMLIGVLAQNPACGFYERMGGKPVREEMITLAGTDLLERWYGWEDLSTLLA